LKRIKINLLPKEFSKMEILPEKTKNCKWSNKILNNSEKSPKKGLKQALIKNWDLLKALVQSIPLKKDYTGISPFPKYIRLSKSPKLLGPKRRSLLADLLILHLKTILKCAEFVVNLAYSEKFSHLDKLDKMRLLLLFLCSNWTVWEAINLKLQHPAVYMNSVPKD
jgi:hypothetical protein